MEKVLIFGTGQGARKAISSIVDEAEIIAFIDNNKDKVGKEFLGKKIISPSQILDEKFDKIIICSVAYDEIRKQLIDTYKIEKEMIANKYYFHKKRLISYYEEEKKKCGLEKEQQEYLEYIKTHELTIFNAPFAEKYSNQNIDVYYDVQNEMWYTIYFGKKMYLASRYNNRESAQEYVKNIMLEQDAESPHRYFNEKFYVDNGDIVLDGGVAEGNFALEIIDKVKKIYLVENDKEWIEALKCTFAPYMDKVEIVEAFLTDSISVECNTVDNIVGDSKIDFIKMDIEGEELNALKGAQRTLQRNGKLKLDICAYHNVDDEKNIKKELLQYGYTCEVSKGYMVFILGENYNQKDTKKLVRGLIQASK